MTQLIISPHMDDAVFSCFANLVKNNSSVLSIFTKEPKPNVKTLWDRICGQPNSKEMVKTRKIENKRVLTKIGLKVNYLDYLDHQYNSNSYSINDLKRDIANYSNPKNTTYFFPLAGGIFVKHPDHILLRKTGLNLLKEGYIVKFYPDIPYMWLPADLTETKIKTLESKYSKIINHKVRIEVNRLDIGLIKRKSELALEYKSQYKMTNLVSLNNLNRQLKRDYELVLAII